MVGTSRGTRLRVLAYVFGGLCLWLLVLLLTMVSVNRLAELAEAGLAPTLSDCDAACTKAVLDPPTGEPAPPDLRETAEKALGFVMHRNRDAHRSQPCSLVGGIPR